jgi:general nucleoside transport system ATP-binding protein
MIEVAGLTKEFGDCLANDGVSLAVEQGEIKAIVGENGAGKTTLMNMIYGLLQPSSGKIFVRGEEVRFHSPLNAIEAGLGMVHQHFKLAPSLTVFENILLGIELRRSLRIFGRRIPLPFIDLKEEKRRVRGLIAAYALELDPDARVADISIGAKQRVEILKMLYRDVDILILDEPTAVLTPQEADRLIADLKELKARGKTLIVITHKLREVMDVSDSVTVMRRGRVVGSVLTRDTDEVHLAQMMVGRDVVLDVRNEGHIASDEVAYRAEGLSTRNEQGKLVLHDVSFRIRKGEILGVAGVEGNGQSELMKALSGLMTLCSGSVHLGDRDVTNLWPDELRRLGIGMIPEDRYAQGLCRDMSLSENCVSGYHSFPDLCRFGFLDRGAMARKRDELVEGYDIRVADYDGKVSQLSGGNAQKIIIAREMDRDPELLLASQPTRGVDVGSIEFIHRKLLELKAAGKAILLISSDLNEVMSLSDRIIVMFKGAVIGEVAARAMGKEGIGLLMAGIRPEGESDGDSRH